MPRMVLLAIATRGASVFILALSAGDPEDHTRWIARRTEGWLVEAKKQLLKQFKVPWGIHTIIWCKYMRVYPTSSNAKNTDNGL